ncbi:class I SAM-dependent methyltransferase [Amycolatopsis rhizosphaerae]|uniref:Class I SAM-dependent methyltransferase n=2 Tax=Amycolatopsis rhizosphaerae TaxID=2053003 RepID=A0A558CMA5_9PSEU|nr:class I SAM-dependent methyltransferase [Amycolatopsis rhizosphaerae]
MRPHERLEASRLENQGLARHGLHRPDHETIAAYETHAAAYAQSWESQPADDELHELLEKFLLPGTVAEIGCGSGRDAAWLAAHGWQVTGYDASSALVGEARRLHPETRFEIATLPALDGLPTFDNVYCETVIMHLEPAAAMESVRRLGGLLRPGGRLYLSWRADGSSDRRDERGRLYTKITVDQVLGEIEGFAVLYRSETTSASSGKRVCRIVAQRP